MDNVIRIADKYAMKGLLIMVEDFIMQAAAAATQAGPHTCAGASGRSGGADQQQQLRQRAPHGSLEGSGDSSEPSAAAATPAASVGGPGVFSPHAGDVNYVWRWLELGDRLQMPHVIERCIDFVSSEALLAGDRSDPYPKETPQALLAVLGAATLQKLVSV